MSSVTDRVERLLADDPDAEIAVIALLDWLESGANEDPFGPVHDDVLAAAEQLNVTRLAAYRTWVESTTWTTAEVVDFLATVNDRKGVDRRRKRGHLVGFRWGNTTRHPVWQFDPRTRDVRVGVKAIISALRGEGIADEVIHQIGLHPSYDADDKSIADLLQKGSVDLAVRIAWLATDQS